MLPTIFTLLWTARDGTLNQEFYWSYDPEATDLSISAEHQRLLVHLNHGEAGDMVEVEARKATPIECRQAEMVAADNTEIDALLEAVCGSRL